MAKFDVVKLDDGYYACTFLDERGDKKTIQSFSAETLLRKVEKYIEKYGGSAISVKRGTLTRPRQRTPGVTWGRPKGTTNAAMRNAIAFKNGLKDLFGAVMARAVMANSASASAGNARITDDSARAILKNTYKNRGGFDTYTGNLERAYAAIIIQGRKIAGKMYLDDTPKGNPVVSVRGKRRVTLFKRGGKKARKITQNSYKRYRARKRGRLHNTYDRVDYRYFKRWERQDGYRSKSITAGRTRIGGFGRMAGDRMNRVQSGIIIENTAPYSAAVQAAGYKVLPNARAMGYRLNGRQEKLLTTVTKKMLRAAKLI